jgi:hypothetical protein
MRQKDFDPHGRVISEQDGLEYSSLGHLICGTPIDCARNHVIARLHDHPRVKAGIWTWKEAVLAQYQHQDRNGNLYAARSNPDDRRHLPQGIEFFDPGSPEGAGSPSPQQTSVDPLHAADQPTV